MDNLQARARAARKAVHETDTPDSVDLEEYEVDPDLGAPVADDGGSYQLGQAIGKAAAKKK